MSLNRREFLGRTAATAASIGLLSKGLAAMAQATAPTVATSPINSVFGGVPIGCTSLCFSANPIEEVPDLLKRIGFGMTEITSAHLEPLGAAPGGAGAARPAGANPPAGGSNPQSPPQAAARPTPVPGTVPQSGPRRAADPEGWAKLRDWRLNTPLDYFAGIGKRFSDAGVSVWAYNTHFGLDITDEELDRSFAVTRAMGGQIVTAVCPPTNEFAKRMDVFAKKNKMRVGIHNEDGPLNSQAAYDTLLAGCSDYMGINLDIGHYANSGGDPVALLRNRKDIIWDVHLTPGRDVAGTGDIPPKGDTVVRTFLTALKESKLAIPCNLEATGRRTDRYTAVAEWFGYSKAVLEG